MQLHFQFCIFARYYSKAHVDNNKLKIGLFNESFPPIQDGVAQVVENYAKLLSERGHDVTVATAKVPFFDYPVTYHVKNIVSVPLIFRLPYRVGLPVWMAPFQPILNFKAEIYHLHSPFTSGRIALKLGKKFNAPVVATFHSKYRDDFLRSVKSDRVADLMVKRIVGVFEEADEVWVPQEGVKEVLRSYGYRGPIEVVSNAIDYDLSDLDLPMLRKQARQMLDVDGDTPCFLFVGQIIKEKRVDFILDALTTLHEKGYRFKMFYVGTGYWVEELKLKIRLRHLRDCVIYKGQISDRSALQLYYAAADLFLFPSLYDTFGLVIREAAVHRTPSLMMRQALCAKGIKEDVSGFLVDDTSPEAFALKIIEIMDNKTLYNSVCDHAEEDLGLTWKKLMPEVEDRYRSLIKRKQSK
ncbi:MAG: glycosyltransferase [Bacteroidales bacterium]|nr:glycosyltransferase [Bacteroidales bacterium]